MCVFVCMCACIGTCVFACVCACMHVCIWMCVHMIFLYYIAGLKSKKQQLEHNQRQLQEKIGHTVTGIS